MTDIERELVAAIRKLLKAYESVLPGVRYIISVKDYALLNDAPIDAQKAIAKAETQ